MTSGMQKKCIINICKVALQLQVGWGPGHPDLLRGVVHAHNREAVTK